MKGWKRIISVCLVCAAAVSFAACGSKLKKSDISSGDVQNELWNMDLDASAEKIQGFRAQTPLEVMQLWSQAKKQGNGALMYGVYSSDLKVIFLDKMKSEKGSWNMDYQPEVQDSVHQYSEVEYNDPEELKDEHVFVSDVTLKKIDGKTYYTQVVIKLMDGGYFITSDGAEYEVQPDEYGENYLNDYVGEALTEAQ